MSKYLRTDFLFYSELLVSVNEKSDIKKKTFKVALKGDNF